MRDVLEPESTRWRRLLDVFAAVVGRAGYGQIVLPVMEDLGVFTRIGDATDVVTKEMYDFTDKGGRHVALRPESTAGVCRAYVQHRPATPWKVWYTGPNFRYERPQRGRYRQFEQVGIEVLDVDDPAIDVEVIALGWEFFSRLGLRRVELHLNSLGEPDDRAQYCRALGAYFETHRDSLSDASRNTLERNPLRVLDSKRADDAEVIAAAPSITEYLSESAAAHYRSVCAGLDSLGIPFVENTSLVRGLDYYRRTTFEFVGGTLDSAQNALGGGGRYDGLVEDLGGPPTPGIGFALGVERTLIACDDEGVFEVPANSPQVFVVDTTGGDEAIVVTARLRAAGFACDRAFGARSLRSQMKSADRSGAEVAVLIGPDEVDTGTLTVRHLRRQSEQMTVGADRLIEELSAMLPRAAESRPMENQ
jgi:histidyl-tRNA synthetase